MGHVTNPFQELRTRPPGLASLPRMPPLQPLFKPQFPRTLRLGTTLVTTALLAVTLLAPAGAPATADPDVPIPSPGISPTDPVSRAKRLPAARFKISTFNILGSQHTAGRGGYGPGTKRARITARLIKRRDIDVIGLQEVQEDQLRVLRRNLPGYTVWPGRQLGGAGVRLQIVFRKSMFKLVDHGKIMTRFDRQTRPVPWVLLKSRLTGRKLYAIDIHNSPQGLEGERDSATREEIGLIRRLRRHHRPVFVLGDMNEKEEWFCRVVGHTDLHSANGGQATRRSCDPPDRPLRIDWIMGGGRSVHFSGYREFDDARVRQASDHELLRAAVRIGPKRR